MSDKIVIFDSPEVLSHNRVGERYRMVVQVGTLNGEGLFRTFEWGLIPVATDMTPMNSYAFVHDRPLIPGSEVVTEEEYMYLQACEAREVLDYEMQEFPRQGASR